MLNRSERDSLAENKNNALAACAYARENILWGSSQLVNNTYEACDKRALVTGVNDLRTICQEYPDYLSGIDMTLQEFYHTVDTCKQLLLGNCMELAQMALDYVVHHTEDVEAEIYGIWGGDHYFLVIGRDAGSHPYEPDTWGSDAYICDPWSNNVYPASEYLTKLKNFRCEIDPTTELTINYSDDFNEAEHVLYPFGNFNTTHIKQQGAVANEIFAKKAELIIKATDKLHLQLMMITKKLADKYGNDDSRRAAVMRIVENLNTATQALKADLEIYRSTPKHSLKDRLAETIKAHRKVISSPQEQVLLDDDVTATEVKQALAAAQEEIDNSGPHR